VFKAFKTSVNWRYLIKGPSGQQSVNIDHKEKGLESMDLINLAQDMCKLWVVV
jgi:hypothetical protein